MTSILGGRYLSAKDKFIQNVSKLSSNIIKKWFQVNKWNQKKKISVYQLWGLEKAIPNCT